MVDQIRNKTISFYTAILNAYRAEEERETVPKLDLQEDLTDDFTAMLVAMKVFYEQFSDGDCDLIEFVSVLNRLAFQYLHEAQKEKEELGNE